MVTILSPWIRFAFNYISKKTFELLDNQQLESEHKKTIKKAELERSRADLFATKETELIQRAKRGEEISEIENEELKERLKHEIDSLRRERDQLSETREENEFNLSDIETEILRAAAQNGNGNIYRRDYISGRSIQVGTLVLGQEGPREFSKYESALKSLLIKRLIQEVDQDGKLFELTHTGWKVADTL